MRVNSTGWRYPVGEVRAFIRAWPVESKFAAEEMMHLHNTPHVITEGFLLWNYNSPWKRSIVYRDLVVHHFPFHHMDTVEQIVDYKVPSDFYGKLIEFNGSISINRTRGEISVGCYNERMNCIILNLSHDIVLGHKTVEEARRKLAEMAMALRLNWPVDYAESLHFNPSAREGDYLVQNAGDPDVSLIKKGIAEFGRDIAHQAQRVWGS